jgi:BirA family biotin operon repressor/biotin-[acetyl-CoA-carboxylase] ligase
MMAAVAACEAVCHSTEIRPAIKWPNDLRVAGKKIGGILIESRPLAPDRRAYVLGFGINCLQHAGHFPPGLRETATSLELAASHPIDRVAVIRSLIAQLDRRLGRTDWASDETLQAAWLSFAEPIGQRITLRSQGKEYTGCTVAVDPLGGLTVQLDNGRPMWFDPMLTSVV